MTKYNLYNLIYMNFIIEILITFLCCFVIYQILNSPCIVIYD